MRRLAEGKKTKKQLS